MTLAELIAAQRTALAEQLTRRAALTATLQSIRDNLGETVAPETQARIDTTIAERRTVDADIEARQANVAELEAEQARDQAADRLQREVNPGAGRPAYDRVARVGAEERTYRPDTDPTGRQFLRDIGTSFLQPSNFAVRDRMERHDREGRVEYAAYMDRAVGTGAFAGLTVPQYLTDMYAPLARALRPFADACNGHPLPPDGMTLNLSRITTGTSAALQASENAAVSSTDIDDTLLTINVQTNAGQQVMSRQSIERGTGTEDVTVQDLFRAYNTTLDSTLLNQAATGLTNVATSVPYVDATPTVAELYPKIVQAISQVEFSMLNMASGDNLAVMHSRRWYWLQNALSATWPLMSQPGIAAQMLGSNFGEVYGAGVRGVLPNGTPVIVDNNVGTLLGAGTEDEIYLVDRQECHLWEDASAPVFIRAEQPAAASLGVLFVLYGFFAYTFSRYTQAQKVNGTGLIAPAFTGV
jgi:hypothetical protein